MFHGAALSSGGPYEAADVAVWRRNGIAPPLEVRVAIIGNVDSGKSTLVGVMTRRYGQSIVNLVTSIFLI